MDSALQGEDYMAFGDSGSSGSKQANTNSGGSKKTYTQTTTVQQQQPQRTRAPQTQVPQQQYVPETQETTAPTPQAPDNGGLNIPTRTQEIVPGVEVPVPDLGNNDEPAP